MIKEIFSVFLIIFFITMLTSCRHTVHGFGEDVEGAGKKIERSTK